MIELLKKLGSNVAFRPEEGPFRSKLVETFVSNIEEESVELFSERNCDIQVRDFGHTLKDGLIRFLIVSDLGERTMECALSALNDDERDDLTKQLSQLSQEQTASVTPDSTKVIVRKNVHGMLDTHLAAQKLGCSETFLKSIIPCTDYSWSEVDGKKEIHEYYWSQNLIDRLCSIKIKGATPEDLQYVSAECCHGDSKWAEDILASLGQPLSPPKVHGAQAKGRRHNRTGGNGHSQGK